MVYMLLGTGFEETEALTPLDLMRRAGISVLTVGVNGRTVTGGHGIAVRADIALSEMDLTKLDMLVLPGGAGGVESLRKSKKALSAVRFAWENGKRIAAICAAPTILAQLHITDGQPVTCYPGCEKDMGSAVIVPDAAVVEDGRLITGTSAGCAIPFALALIAALKGEDAAKRVADQIVIR